jgi:membrane protease YdiL (CAAX protease family)
MRPDNRSRSSRPDDADHRPVAHAPGVVTERATRGVRRHHVVLAVGLLVAVAAAGRLGPRHTMVVAGPAGAVAMLVLARRAGVGLDAVGLGRRSWRRGAVYAAVCVTGVAAVYSLAVLVPVTRAAFLDERYPAGDRIALVNAFMVIPLGTVLFEEVAFRGVLWGMLRDRLGAAWATAVSSALFGCWHVLPSLRLNEVNPAVADLVGPGPGGRALAVAGAVVFTATAGVLLCELRRRSGSLLAPAGLHWAVNGLGVLASAGVAH